MSKIAYGYGHLRIGDGDVIDAPNFAPCDRALEGYFLDTLIQKGVPASDDYYGASCRANLVFARYGNLRYKKDSTLVLGANNSYLYKSDGYPMRYWSGVQAGDVVADFQRRRIYSATKSLATTNDPAAIGSIAWFWHNGNSALPIGVAPYLPNSWYGYPALGFIDIPGTQIGLVYRHPEGRSQFFNEVGVVWTSQGSIEMSGAYAPPENLLQHRMYRVYYTKSGGCGKLEAIPRLDTDGVVTTSSDNFNSAAVTFVAGDVGKYIAIRGASNAINNGTFLITAFVDAHNVTVDASTINQPFVTESGLGFEVREGPVGEYFVQSKPYLFSVYDYNTSWYFYYGTVLPFNDMTHELRGNAYIYALPTSVIHDRGACWWWLTNVDYNNALGLLRWKHLSPEGVDPVYGDGDITNMPAGITKWRDMDIDVDSKIWIGIDDSANTIGDSLLKIDPYPGGNARYPDCVGKFDVQTGPTDASGLPSRNVRGVVCDTKNNRTWALCHPDGVNNGGLAYTEDGGVTWSRMHQLSALTGTQAVKATGSIACPGDVAAAGSLNFSVYDIYPGDWFILSDGYTQPLRFEYYTTGSVTPGSIPIQIVGGTYETAIETAYVINASPCQITATAVSTTVNLVNGNAGPIGNIAITKGSTSPWTVSGMSGGSLNILDGEKVVLNDGYTSSGLGAVNYWFSRQNLVYATGFIYIDIQPDDGATFTIDDGTTPITFEFDDDSSVTPGNVAVTIGATVANTRTNTNTAINGTSSKVRAVGVTGSQVNLQCSEHGSAYNIAITKTGSIAFFVAGMGFGAPGYFAPATSNTGTTSVTFGTPSGNSQVISGMTGGTFDSESIGHYLNISGSSDNDGTWKITAVNSSTEVVVDNPYGQSETVSCTWTQRGDKNNVRAYLRHTVFTSVMATDLAAAINNTPSSIAIAASPSTSTVALQNDHYGVEGNIAITETVVHPDFTVTGMSGGTAWEVAGDGVTLTNPAADSSFTAQLAIGDWITLIGVSGTTKRHIASITDNNTLVLTAATAYPGAVEGWEGLPGVGALPKGVLSPSQAVMALFNTPGTLDNQDNGPANPPCDYDSDGRVYWMTNAYAILVSNGGTGLLNVSTGSVSHGLAAGDRVNIYGTTSYNGTFSVIAVPSSTSFVVSGTWSSNQNGSMGNVIFRVGAEDTVVPGHVTAGSLPTYNSATWTTELRSLTVMHMPEFADNPHPMQDFVWIGSHGSELALIHSSHDWSAVYVPPGDVTITGIADLGGGVVRATTSGVHGMTAGDTAYVNNTTSYNGKYTVLAATTNTFDFTHTFIASETGNLGSGNATITRYHHSVTPNNWPLKMALGTTYAWYNTRAVVDPSRGTCWLVSSGRQYDNPQYSWVYTHPYSGAKYYPGAAVGWAAPSYWAPGAGTIYHQLLNGNFADTDIGFYWSPGGSNMTTAADQAYSMYNGGWAGWVWDGTAWGPAAINAHSYTLDFLGAAGGPYIHNKTTWAVGKGAKRCHEDRQPLQYGMSIRFVDAEGPVSQADQFIVDETSTFGAYIGRGKGNIETASWAADSYRSPTVYREGTEPVVEAKNLWTVDGGVDGGFVDNASQSAFPVFKRGIAEYSSKHPYGVGGTYAATYYPNFNDNRASNNTNGQYMAALRIADELELSADLSVVAASDIVTSASRDFTVADEGKSIFIEGAVNAANNGQAVIKKANPSGSNAKEAQVYKIYTVTESTLRWKLRDIPAAGYVALTLSQAVASMITNLNFFLYSSSDYGQTWGSYIRRIAAIYGGAANAPNTVDTGVSVDVQTINKLQLMTGDNGPMTLLFDIRDLPEDVRRRQYWKITRTTAYSSSDYFMVSSILLYDDNMAPLGRPAANKVTDADDPLFVATLANMTVVAYYDLSATISAVDDGDGDGYTDLLTVSGGNLYEQSGVATGNVTTAGVFTSAGASFAPTDVGKILRIPDAQAVTGVGLPAWTGFSAIATVVDANTVNLSHTFVANYTNIDWALLAFGSGDRLFFDSPAVMDTNMGLRSFYPTVEDVISNTQIRVANIDVPVSLSALPFHIWRPYPNGVADLGPQYYNGYSTTKGFYDPSFGTLYYSDLVEFITLLDLTLNATTPADDDGDGRTNVINLPSALPASVVVGDYITISHATYGRRTFEIKTIDGPRTQITVTYDEIFPSLTSISYYVYRRRNWKSHIKKAVTTCQEQI